MAALLLTAVLLVAQLSSSAGSIVSIPPQASQYPKINAGDKAIIKAFLAAIPGGSLKVPLVVCDDLLFYCFPDGRIKYIYVAGKNLKGPIPPILGQLTTLRGLFLQSNKFNGTIPSTFAALTNLVFLHLEVNQLAGPVPSFLTKMTGLMDLSISYNLFSGTAPAFGSLLTLQLQENYLSAVVRANGKPLCGNIELNCLFGSSLPSDCPYYKQRKKVHCRNFCNTTQTGGACGGKGVCALAPHSAGAYCICNTGYNNKAVPFTCVKT